MTDGKISQTISATTVRNTNSSTPNTIALAGPVSAASEDARSAAPWYLRKVFGRSLKSTTYESPRQLFAAALKAKTEVEGDADALAVLDDADRLAAHASTIAMRYALQSQARKWATERKDSLKRCQLWLIPRSVKDKMEAAGCDVAEGVEVWRSQEDHDGKGHSAHYRGLESCKSVWKCPVCAPRIMERRTKDLEAVVQAHADAGGTLVHATFTVRHYAKQSCYSLVRKIRTAYNGMTGLRAFKGLAEVSFIGAVRATEVTYGVENGFHPHFHVLYFVKPGVTIDPERFEEKLFSLWEGRVQKAGLGTITREHGVKVRVAESQQQLLAQYVAKFNKEPESKLWGAEAEMTKGHTKTGDIARFHPFDFLRSGLIRDQSLPWQELWTDYVKAFKGQAQLIGVKKIADLYEINVAATDEEAHDTGAEGDFMLLARLSADDWYAVIKCGARGLLLHKAAKQGADGVNEVVEYCRGAVDLLRDSRSPACRSNHTRQ